MTKTLRQPRVALIAIAAAKAAKASGRLLSYGSFGNASSFHI
jgi:hypothetical protein